jgi:hypothetical protein
VASLRALLASDFEKYDELNARLDQATNRRGYTALIAAAFFKAAYRRFAKEGTAADVIDFVGDVRTRSDQVGEQLDPRAAERVLLATVSDGNDIEGMDGETRIATEFILLAALIADQNLDDTGLDRFLAEARSSPRNGLTEGAAASM